MRTLRLLLAGALTAMLGTACAGSQDNVLDTHESESCHWATGEAAVCIVTITNDPTSTVTFNWHGVSDPSGATFDPDHGSIAPGHTSDPITVTDPFICPITLIFQDDDRDL
ncbi:hypothetical protein ACFV5G_27210 [Streptomyces sp. NPDC059766]|uniref:hypothetical protein n=1 Tax=Streptomyces sp. NPDC059766 TaxID=3346940 RepID=UPI00364D1715